MTRKIQADDVELRRKFPHPAFPSGEGVPKSVQQHQQWRTRIAVLAIVRVIAPGQIDEVRIASGVFRLQRLIGNISPAQLEPYADQDQDDEPQNEGENSAHGPS